MLAAAPTLSPRYAVLRARVVRNMTLHSHSDLCSWRSEVEGHCTQNRIIVNSSVLSAVHKLEESPLFP